MINLSNITYYPIKACRGFDIPESRVERMGLADDRRMMVVTPEGEFLTQREHPKLALITPTLKNGSVTLSAPNFDSIRFAIQKSGTPTLVNIWKSKDVSAIDQGDESAQWLSDWLGVSVRLVHVDERFKRKLNPEFAVSADDHTGFADGYPILIISEASLQDLNSKLYSASPDELIPPEHCRQRLRAFRRGYVETHPHRRCGNGARQALSALRSDHHRQGNSRKKQRTAQDIRRVPQTKRRSHVRHEYHPIERRRDQGWHERGDFGVRK